MGNKHRSGGWAVTLKDAENRGLHPKQTLLNPFHSVVRELHPEIHDAFNAYYDETPDCMKGWLPSWASSLNR